MSDQAIARICILASLLCICLLQWAVAAPLDLPDSRRTPGATNPDVTPSTVKSTICKRGWTATVRPPAQFTDALKRKQLATYYLGRGTVAGTEEDHLIPLELGGAPRSVANLWPQRRTLLNGAAAKDRCENLSRELVCAGKRSLAEAQRGMASNWIGWCAAIVSR